ncbi:MAG: hypothetical protein KDK27_04360, partial [Leptospiraceae bacterium]|nr:hypothetical protein [Leptospiraceae bacterium]
MLIFGERHFLETEFDNESEIEAIVFKKYEYLFGPGSFVIPRAKIKTEQGSASIPDGFIIDLETKNWYVVEVELIRHGVWTHIAPQVSKQLIASQQDLSRKLLIEVAVNLYKENESIRRIFEDEQIPDIDVRRILADIMEKPPIIGIPIDRVTSDLRQWAESLRVQVKLWSVKKYQLLDGRETIYEFPGEFRPILDTAEINSNSRRT